MSADFQPAKEITAAIKGVVTESVNPETCEAHDWRCHRCGVAKN
jgi:hypothetical protein